MKEKLKKLKSGIELIRPLNCAMTSIAILIGYSLAEKYYLEGFSWLLAMISGFFIAAAGNVINDFFDIETDKKVHPERPLPKREISPKMALDTSIILFYVGIVITLPISWFCFLLAVINSVLLVIYSYSLEKKGLIGNISISYLTSSTFIFGALVVEKISLLVALMSLMAFFAVLAREIVKDVEDIVGDKIRERRTLPMQIGKSYSLILVMIFGAIGVLISFLPVYYGLVNYYYIVLVGVADIFIFLGIIFGFVPYISKNFFKIGMILGLIGFLVGGV